MPGTVAGANPGDTNQAGDLLGLHRAHERARCDRQKRHLAERAGRCAERTDDGVPAFECLTQDDLITRVSDDEFRSLKTARLFGRPRQYGYVVLSRYPPADDQAASAAGRPNNQYLRLSSLNGLGFGIMHG